MDNSTNNKNIFQSELPCEKKNGHSIIQEFINNYPYGVQDLIKLLECGYQITYEDRKIMKEQFPTDTYKYYATFSRLAFKLYQEGQAELITTLIRTFQEQFIRLKHYFPTNPNISVFKPMYGYVSLITQ